MYTTISGVMSHNPPIVYEVSEVIRSTEEPADSILNGLDEYMILETCKPALFTETALKQAKELYPDFEALLKNSSHIQVPTIVHGYRDLLLCLDPEKEFLELDKSLQDASNRKRILKGFLNIAMIKKIDVEIFYIVGEEVGSNNREKFQVSEVFENSIKVKTINGINEWYTVEFIDILSVKYIK